MTHPGSMMSSNLQSQLQASRPQIVQATSALSMSRQHEYANTNFGGAGGSSLEYAGVGNPQRFSEPAYPDDLLRNPPSDFNIQNVSADLDLHMQQPGYFDGTHNFGSTYTGVNPSHPQMNLGHVNIPGPAPYAYPNASFANNPTYGNQPAAPMSLDLGGRNVMADNHGNTFVELEGFGFFPLQDFVQFMRLGNSA